MIHSTSSLLRRFSNRRVSVLPLAILLTACSHSVPPKAGLGSDQKAPFPEIIADPIEPVNRAVWAANRGVLKGVIQPTARVYRAVVPKPVRGSIDHFTRNVTYPGRVVNHVLQGRWQGAGDESLRFLTNTTVGVGGFFDVASRWKMPQSEADFSETFGKWGWQPQSFVMLPLLGPSDDRHVVGAGADALAEPWNYATPYQYAAYGSRYNALSGKSEQAARFISENPDSYTASKYFWTYVTKDAAPDWTVNGPKDLPTLQTLGVALIKCQDPEFPERGREITVRLPSTGRKMTANYWLQPTAAPIVYIAPGLSSHRLSDITLALAESIYQAGYSVVTTTGIFHPDFMENASTAALPAYPPVDSHDLLVELTEFDRALEKAHPGKLSQRALVGFSMGGFQAMYLSARENQAGEGLLKFDRYLAIDSPVDLQHGARSIDQYQNIANEWPAAERQAKMNNAIHKTAKFFTLPPAEMANPPFSGTETKFLMGLSFRVTLRDTIYSSQRRNNMGVLKTPLGGWRREEVYNEILKASFRDYFVDYAVPYYLKRGVTPSDFAREVNLRNYTGKIRAQSKLRVIVNANDFFLPPRDLAWLRSTFGKSRLTVFPSGGHLGNLASPSVQKAIVGSLSGLK